MLRGVWSIRRLWSTGNRRTIAGRYLFLSTSQRRSANSHADGFHKRSRNFLRRVFHIHPVPWISVRNTLVYWWHPWKRNPNTLRNTWQRVWGNPQKNSGVRRFACEQLVVMICVVHCIRKARRTFSGKTSDLFVLLVVIAGHRDTYEWRRADGAIILKVRVLLIFRDLSDIRGFLCAVCVVWMFIRTPRNTQLLSVQLTEKGIDFKFEKQKKKTIRTVGLFVISFPAIRVIYRTSDLDVITTIRLPWRAVSFVFSRMGSDEEQYPLRSRSIT